MQEENNTNAENTESGSRRSILKGAAAVAAAAVAASVPRKASAQDKDGWPCAAQLRGPYGSLTIEDIRGRLQGRIVLDGISKTAAQQIDFMAQTPSELRGISLVELPLDAWEQNTVLGW